ncbi:MAG: MBL fold metallo-hydrolase [Bacilli bacterium]|nr:MBL fold metallo-hydrolase [Bacilli bacterium]
MKISVLASGSLGNVTYIETANGKILIDCGLNFKQLGLRLNVHHLSIKDLDGVFITHEHNDHIKGLDVLLKKIETTCYLTEETHKSFRYQVRDSIKENQISYIRPYESVIVKDMEILPFSISHDASDAVGYIIYAEGFKVVYITDIGYLPSKDIELIENADLYVFESNYDVTMLFTSDRPFYLKQRIDSVKGHMSNNDSAYNMTKLIGPKTKQIILAHPSRECNLPAVAIRTYDEVFKEYGLSIDDYNLMVALQDTPTELIELKEE